MTEETAEHLFKRQLRQRNTDSLRLTALLGGILVPFFWVLDWWVIPRYVYGTLALRAFCAVYSVLLIIGIARRRKWCERYVTQLGLSYTLAIAWSIAVMCWLHQGYESSYYAGINLVVIGVGFLFSWPTRTSVLFCSLTYLFYMAPLACGTLTIHNTANALGNQFFLIATMTITLAAQNHRYQLEQREFDGNLALQRTKASLEQAFARLQQLDRLKSQFFNNITHELRTPLTMILSPLDSLIDGELGELSPKHRRYLVPLRRNALKLLKLINNLLDVAKIEERRLQLRPVRTDLHGLLAEVVEHSRPLASRKEIEVSCEVTSTRDDLYLDLEQIERVLVNLVSNALKFTNPRGQVSITLQDAEDGVQLKVRDTGIGIAADQLERVFERFSQADGSITRRYGGTGIGLALAREVVELHGGTLTVTSTPGEGSEFTAHLWSGREHLDPALLVATAASDGAESLPAESREWTQQLIESLEFRFLDIDEATERRIAARGDDSAKGTKVLVVEDHLDVLRFIHMNLQEEHAVYLAQNGAQGLELARAERPDVIVTDYMMPEMDGVSLIRALRADKKTADIPVIMLTGKSRVDDRVAAREAGADIHLSKPFSPKELRQGIQQLLAKRGRQAAIVVREHIKSLELISAGLAHEINNPLSYIKNAVFAINSKVNKIDIALEQLDLPDSEQRRVIEKARKQIARMNDAAERGVERISEVVQLVRRYAREGYPEETSPLVLDDAIRDVGRLIAPKTESDVKIDVDLNAAGVTVRCIPDEMSQVLRNLWQNAIDAVGSTGTVRVSTQRDGNTVIYEVRDNGPGIAPENLSRIFTPFFTTKVGGKGMGLGLAITHQVVERAGGAITVDSKVGEGTTFQVRLPVAGDETTSTGAAA